MCGFLKYTDQEQNYIFQYICYIKALILFFPMEISYMLS